jgi:hypothetical protein
MNNEQDIINQISLKHFGISPKSFHRIAKGICNDVFDVVLQDKEIIIRLSSDDSFLKGSSHNIPLLKSLGINVPDILAEDYSKEKHLGAWLLWWRISEHYGCVSRCL